MWSGINSLWRRLLTVLLACWGWFILDALMSSGLMLVKSRKQQRPFDVTGRACLLFLVSCLLSTLQFSSGSSRWLPLSCLHAGRSDVRRCRLRLLRRDDSPYAIDNAVPFCLHFACSLCCVQVACSWLCTSQSSDTRPAWSYHGPRYNKTKCLELRRHIAAQRK